jgi:hypothetical protein
MFITVTTSPRLISEVRTTVTLEITKFEVGVTCRTPAPWKSVKLFRSYYGKQNSQLDYTTNLPRLLNTEIRLKDIHQTRWCIIMSDVFHNILQLKCFVINYFRFILSYFWLPPWSEQSLLPHILYLQEYMLPAFLASKLFTYPLLQQCVCKMVGYDKIQLGFLELFAIWSH